MKGKVTIEFDDTIGQDFMESLELKDPSELRGALQYIWKEQLMTMGEDALEHIQLQVEVEHE